MGQENRSVSDLELLYNSMNELVALHELVLDEARKPLDYRILDCNRAFEKVTGISRAVAVGALASELYGTGKAPFLDDYARVVRTRLPLTFEASFAPMGKQFFISVFPAGPDRFGTVSLDISDWKTAQRERDEAMDRLVTSQKRFQSLFDHSSVPIWEEDFSALKRGFEELRAKGISDFRRYFRENLDEARRFASLVRVTDLNEESLLFFGVSDREDLTRCLSEYFVDDSWPVFAEELAILAEGGTRFSGEIQIRFRGEPRRFVRLNLAVVPGCEATLSQVMVSFVDITERVRAEEERRRLEDQLRQAQKMEAVGRLAGGIAHDFNNALTGIMGSASLALLDSKPEGPLAAHLQEILKISEGTAQLIKQLLAFSRRQIIDPKVVDLWDLVAGLEAMLRRLLGAHISLQMVRGARRANVKVDQSQIEQLLVNLVLNARDAMEAEGGQLTVETSVIQLGDEYCRKHPYVMPGRYVMLAVSDTGCGMSAEVREHCFEPFFTTKPKDKGTGLGLAMVYGAVKQSGGSLEVYSEPGHGSTFKVYLPVVEDELAQRAPTRPMGGLPGGSETVVVVEDEPSVKEVAAKVLRRLGYRVLDYLSAEDALAALEHLKEPVHLLITDVMLPGIKGPALARKLEAQRPGLKVLFTSGYTENNIVHHGVLDPGISFLGKPYTLETLSQRIRALLDS